MRHRHYVVQLRTCWYVTTVTALILRHGHLPPVDSIMYLSNWTTSRPVCVCVDSIMYLSNWTTSRPVCVCVDSYHVLVKLDDFEAGMRLCGDCHDSNLLLGAVRAQTCAKVASGLLPKFSGVLRHIYDDIFISYPHI